ncbi:unnamed protein product [Adineta ricciae]|uniref:MARVEL domain-containing protein n=1 Tax=Adineta ricciae TaxID=249248 RepID=A0A814CP00_ADIRI|nr:unnamed protein product [Adineta ricciae]CAF1014000.1 unnamed protein product [Adineta ricciae]
MPSTSNQNTTADVPTYASSDPNKLRSTKCVPGTGFIKTLFGLLNLIIIISCICILATAGVASKADCELADLLSFQSPVQVSAVHTRNAIIVFAVFGLLLILIDSILYITKLIFRLSVKFDLAFSIVMIIFGGIYFILACCAAAWEKKLGDTVGVVSKVQHKGAPAAASFFLFVTTGFVLTSFILRLVRPEISHEE